MNKLDNFQGHVVHYCNGRYDSVLKEFISPPEPNSPKLFPIEEFIQGLEKIYDIRYGGVFDTKSIRRDIALFLYIIIKEYDQDDTYLARRLHHFLCLKQEVEMKKLKNLSDPSPEFIIKPIITNIIDFYRQRIIHLTKVPDGALLKLPKPEPELFKQILSGELEKSKQEYYSLIKGQ